jgi:replicative DNA helicase
MVHIQETYLYERPFRLRILAACFQKEWYAAKGNRVVMPAYFNTIEEQNLMHFLGTFYVDYHRAPSLNEVNAKFVERDELMDDLIKEIFDIIKNEPEDLEYAKANAEEFAALQTMGVAISKVITIYEKGQHKGIKELIMEADRLSHDTDLGIDLVDDIEKWLIPSSEIETERINSGITHMDQAMHGGLARGKYGLLLGPVNGGKTTTLMNIGCGAASMISKANVLHIAINEISAIELAEAYASRITGLPHEEALANIDSYLDRFDNSVNLRLHGKIRIKDFARLSIEDLIMYLDSLAFSGFKPDMLILDYADLIEVNPRAEYRFELGRIARELRALAIERNMAVWSASQVQRGAASKYELIGMDSIAESYLKAAVADMIISINMSNEEKDAGLSRLFCAKNRIRHTKSHWIVSCKYDLRSGVLESTGVMEYVEWLAAKAENNGKQLQIIK